jgi:hypothetical protein
MVPPGRRERAAARIGEGLAGAEFGLLADDAGPRTSCIWPWPSTIFQWRERSCTRSVDMLVISTV